MLSRKIIYIIISTIILGLSPLFAIENRYMYRHIVPDNTWQVIIKKIFNSKSKASYFYNISNLKNIPNGMNDKKLLRQILYFASNNNSFETYYFSIKLINNLQINKMYVTSSLIPQLKNKKIKNLIYSILTYVDNRNKRGAPDFSYYRQLLTYYKQNKIDIAYLLIDLMYKIHPNEALNIISKVYSNKFNYLKEKNIIYLVYRSKLENKYHPNLKNIIYEKTREKLVKLLNDGTWWQKLYANAVFKKYRFLQ